MKPSINTHILLGEVSTEPEVRATARGSSKLSFRLKTGRPMPNGQVYTDTHNVVYWGANAPQLAEQIRIGDLVQVTGRVGTRGYDGRDGQKRWITETTARDLSPFGGEGAQQGPPQQQRQQRPPQRQAAPPQQQPAFEDGDDIPF